MAATFISYRRDDAAGYAGRLRESLERRLGPDGIFRDVDALKPGQDFVQAIEARLVACKVMLVVIGREWLDARQPSGTRRLDDPLDFVRIEVAVGLARRQVLVVPVLVEGATMPSSEALPDNIRALARRHALSLRDETWDEDVGRLVAVINETTSSAATVPSSSSAGAVSAGSRASRGGRIWSAAGALLVALLGLGWYLSRGSTDARPGSAVDPPRAPRASIAEHPYTIDIPRIAEAAFGSRLYTLVSGNMMARGDVSELRLRLRLMNYGPGDANFWNASFRLSVAGRILEPSGDLNDIVPGNSLRYAVVVFQLPPDATSTVFQIREGGQLAEIPLNVTNTGRPPADEQADVPDSLSQAVVRRVSDQAAPLLTADAVSVTLLRVTSRRFANVLRLSFQVRLENRARAPVHSGIVTFRVSAGGDVAVPLDPPNEVIEPAAAISPTLVFDLPTAATQAVLKVISGDRSSTRPFELP